MISSPGYMTCEGSAMRDHPISETCSNPWTPPPRSTNAPNSRTDATRPVITAPGTIDGIGAGSWSERVPLRQIVVAVLLLVLAGAAVYAAVRWNATRRGPRVEAAGAPALARAATTPGTPAVLAALPFDI